VVKQNVDMDVKKEEQDAGNPSIEESFVIYDPDNPPFESLYLCEYLRELPYLEDKGDPNAD